LVTKTNTEIFFQKISVSVSVFFHDDFGIGIDFGFGPIMILVSIFGILLRHPVLVIGFGYRYFQARVIPFRFRFW